MTFRNKLNIIKKQIHQLIKSKKCVAVYSSRIHPYPASHPRENSSLHQAKATRTGKSLAVIAIETWKMPQHESIPNNISEKDMTDNLLLSCRFIIIITVHSS